MILHRDIYDIYIDSFIAFIAWPRIDRSYGHQLYLWIETTFKIKEFVTSMEITHSDPIHPKYKDPEAMLQDGAVLVEHPKCKLKFWLKKDPFRTRAMANIAFSYNEQEDTRYTFLLCLLC